MAVAPFPARGQPLGAERVLQASKRAKLREEDVAPVADRDGRSLSAIPGQDTPQLGQLGVAMLLNQPIHPQPATALTAGAHDPEHCEPGSRVAKRHGTLL